MQWLAAVEPGPWFWCPARAIEYILSLTDEKLCCTMKASQGIGSRRTPYLALNLQTVSYSLTLAKLHVLVQTSFIKLIKLLQNLMKLLPNHIMV